MIRPLTQGVPDFEHKTVVRAYPIFAGLLRVLLRLTAQRAQQSVVQIRAVFDSVESRLTAGGTFLVGNQLTYRISPLPWQQRPSCCPLTMAARCLRLPRCLPKFRLWSTKCAPVRQERLLFKSTRIIGLGSVNSRFLGRLSLLLRFRPLWPTSACLRILRVPLFINTMKSTERLQFSVCIGAHCGNHESKIYLDY